MGNLSQAAIFKGAKAYQGQKVIDRNAMAVKYAPLVKRVALHLKTRLPSYVDIDDLVQSGMIGLIEAIQNFKDGYGATFETYAAIRIRGSIIDELRQRDWTPRSVRQNTRAIREAMLKLSHEKGRPATDVEIAAYLNVDINRYHQMLLESNTSQVMGIEDTGLTDDVIGERPISEITGQQPDDRLFESISDEQFKKSLANAISRLPKRERDIVTFYYDHEMNLREIGLIMGISESRTCQILSQALVRLRSTLDEWSRDSERKTRVVPPRESLIAPGAQSVPRTDKARRTSLLFNEDNEIELRHQPQLAASASADAAEATTMRRRSTRGRKTATVPDESAVAPSAPKRGRRKSGTVEADAAK